MVSHEEPVVVGVKKSATTLADLNVVDVDACNGSYYF